MNKPNLFRCILSIALFLLLCPTYPLQAQSTAEIYQGLKKLGVTGSVLYIAAHPDDENTRFISYLAQEKLYRTGYLSLTRGDGGQNLIGTELGVNLGLIRTRELMAARKIDGGIQFFSRAFDFGFSKNPEETFSIWNKEQVLEDAVYIIRKFKPDIIVCRFAEDSRAGHGHHSASAIIAREAFAAAADPNRFPDQVKQFGIWQAKRMLWNTYSFGSNNTIAEDQFKVEVGGYNVILGKSYGELAADSRSQHKSQGFGVPRQRGAQIEYFKTISGTPPVNDLMDDVMVSWKQIPNAQKAEEQFQKIISTFQFNNPSLSVPALIEFKKILESLPESLLKKIKIQETEKLILECSGYWTAAYAPAARFASGDSIPVTIQAIERSNITASLPGLPAADKDSVWNGTLPQNILKNFSKTYPGKKTISQPYWLSTPHEKGMFILDDKKHTGDPWFEDALTVNYDVVIMGEKIPVSLPVLYKHTDPVKGELYDPLTVSPVLTANVPEQVLLFPDANSKVLTVRFSYWGQAADSFRIKPALQSMNGWKISPADTVVVFKNKSEECEIHFIVQPPDDLKQNNQLRISAIDFKGNQLVLRSTTDINYDHIPPINWYPDLDISLKAIPIKITGKKIAYIKGAGDLVPSYLRQLGYNVEEFTAEDLMEKNLTVFNAIVTGIRAYNTDDRLPFLQDKLMEYVKNGGVYVVQYNTSAATLPKNLGPYPFSVSRNRVTEEDAVVTFINPAHPILNQPNKITQEDFQGWVQERGLYFVEKQDSQYETILKMNDKGEDPQDGSLIVANYGKGKYVYTGISFFRQIPAGVTGAVRLFVNLISK
ncbi:PIG-L family deacetylase [soil metagenome]